MTVRRLSAGFALVAAGAWAASASALELRDARIVSDGPAVAVSLSVLQPFGARAQESLSRGMPASLELTADLWRRRRGWFDEHVATRTVMVRVRYDAWREEYNLQVDLDPTEQHATLADIQREIGAELRISLLPRAGLRPGGRYYVVCGARSRPLTPEALRQVEEFLAARDRPESAAWIPSIPGLGRLPYSFVALLGAISGFEEERARAVTPPFVAP